METGLFELVKSLPESMMGLVVLAVYLVRQNYLLTKQNHELTSSIMKAAAALRESSQVMGEINRALKQRTRK